MQKPDMTPLVRRRVFDLPPPGRYLPHNTKRAGNSMSGESQQHSFRGAYADLVDRQRPRAAASAEAFDRLRLGGPGKDSLQKHSWVSPV
jgi:hypothetical protein